MKMSDAIVLASVGGGELLADALEEELASFGSMRIVEETGECLILALAPIPEIEVFEIDCKAIPQAMRDESRREWQNIRQQQNIHQQQARQKWRNRK